MKKSKLLFAGCVPPSVAVARPSMGARIGGFGAGVAPQVMAMLAAPLAIVFSGTALYRPEQAARRTRRRSETS